MPLTRSDHVAWATRNDAVYAASGGDAAVWRDWAITVLFYAAVHETQGWLVAQNAFPRDHRSRKTELRSRDRRLASLYDQLYSWSRAARYDCWEPTVQELQQAEQALAQVRARI